MNRKFILEDSDDEEELPQQQEEVVESLPDNFLENIRDEKRKDYLEEQKETENDEEQEQVQEDNDDFDLLMSLLNKVDTPESEPEPELEELSEPDPEPEELSEPEPEIKDEDLDIDNLDNLMGQLKEQKKRGRGRPKGTKVKTTTKMVDGLKKTRNGKGIKAINRRRERMNIIKDEINQRQREMNKLEAEIKTFESRYKSDKTQEPKSQQEIENEEKDKRLMKLLENLSLF